MRSTLLLSICFLIIGCNQVEEETPSTISDKGSVEESKLLITESSARFSQESELSPVITKEATLAIKTTEKGETHFNIRYAWANTGFELSLILPDSLVGTYDAKSITASGVSKIWDDSGRWTKDYSGNYTVSASRNDSGNVQATISGELAGSFQLNILSTSPLTGEVEKEEAGVIVDYAMTGYDVFYNNTEKDITIKATDSMSGEEFTFFVPKKTEVRQAVFFTDIFTAYHGLEFAKTLSLGFNGTYFPFYYGIAPFSNESRLSEVLPYPRLLDGILVVDRMTINTYTLPEEPLP